MLAENGQRQSVSGCDKEATEELCVRAPAALQALGQLLLKSHIKKQKTKLLCLDSLSPHLYVKLLTLSPFNKSVPSINQDSLISFPPLCKFYIILAFTINHLKEKTKEEKCFR